MRKVTFLKAALCLAATMLLLALTVGTTDVMAQSNCSPCPTWWVDYDYIFPPCTTPVSVDVQWENGQWSHVVETTDGHKTYPTPNPISRAMAVRVNGVTIPINGTPVWIPYQCDGGMQNMCLRAEVRCNPCLEVKLHLEPCPPPSCQPCPTWWVDYDYIFPPCSTPVQVDVQWANGQATSVTETTDGHKIYPTPNPISSAVAVQINGMAIPIDGRPIWIPYPCDPNMPNMCLRAEVRCNPCLEIKLHLEPCQ
jgi:hypothetical protein